MHPWIKSDKPGKSPDCGMDMVPVYEGEVPSKKMPKGSVMIPIEKQQLIGVKTGIVKTRHLKKIIRTVGRIDYDERRVKDIHTKIEGWIEKLYVDYTGKFVKKGTPLLSIYSPELVSTQEEYLLALKANKYFQKSSFPDVKSGGETLIQATKRRLLLWDITENQIRKLEKTGVVKKSLILHSPINGFVINKTAFEGKYVTPADPLYTIADLSNIWIYADIYEYEIPLIKKGQEVLAKLSYLPGETFKGVISYIYPYLENKTRTVKVRMDFDNKGFKLKPKMYAKVEINVDLGRKLAVPEDAVLDSGIEQIVFIAKEGGHFEPKRVKLGLKTDGYYEVLSGLSEGEKVVTSANFLIDSESRLKSALGTMEHQH
jgi:multidrug efflux pump subunit AcrA (membrane-fusion protein)